LRHEWGKVMVATVQRSMRLLQLSTGSLWSSSFLVSNNLQDILKKSTSSGIPFKLRDMYSIYRCRWNIATYNWKMHNGKI